MAVDSKQGGTNAPTGPGPAATLAGMPAVQANGAFNKRKRPSSLMAQASALPSVENSLDEFIAKANETLIDPSTFNTDQVRRDEDDKRKEHDALRWKATEQQMLQSQAREDSLRRQLDGLQGKLAEAEARAAVAGSGGSQDGIIADLKLRLTMADEKVATSEQKLRLTEAKVGKLESELVTAKSAAAAAPAARDSLAGIGDEEADQRVRIAEAKAVKALAVARAASAGLTVSAADLNAIESGLVISNDFGPKKTPWGAILAGSLISAAIAFTVAFVMFNKKDSPKAAAAAPAAAEAQPQGAAAPMPAAPAKPTATPIEEPADKAAASDDVKAEEPAAKAEEPAAKPVAEEEAPVVEKVAPKATAKTSAAAKAEKAAAAKAAAKEAAAAKAEKAAAAKAAAAAAKASKKTTKKDGGLADPFGDSPAPAKKKTAPKKDSGGLADPF